MELTARPSRTDGAGAGILAMTSPMHPAATATAPDRPLGTNTDGGQDQARNRDGDDNAQTPSWVAASGDDPPVGLDRCGVLERVCMGT